MAIPYNKCLDWGKQGDKVSISGQYKTPAYEDSSKGQLKRAVHALFIETVTQLGVRSLQFTRDLARLILKVPIRSVITPIILPKNWPERRRVVLNIQLTGNSLLQLVAVPVKACGSLLAIVILPVSLKNSKALQDKMFIFTRYVDGKASQWEAIKEQGRKNAETVEEFNTYKDWVISHDPGKCHPDYTEDK